MAKWYKRISCLLLAALMVCGALASADNLTTDSAQTAEPAQSTQTNGDNTARSSQEPVANTESTDSVETKDNTDSSGTEQPDPEPTPEPDPEPDPEEQFSFVSSSASVTAGKSVTLTLSCNVEDTVTDVTSSYPSVAQVSDFGGDQADGTTVTIAGLKKGTATITATTQNGYTATCRVTVKKASTKKDDPNQKPNNNNQKPGNTTPTTPTTPSTNIGSGSTALTSGLTTTTYTKPDHIPSSVALTFSCSLGKYTDTILENMDTYNTYGTFFVPSKDIYRKDDRVRRIVGQGNAIGITLTKEQSSDTHKALRALKRANDRLSTVCGVPTRLVTIEGGSEQLSSDVYTALTEAGYRVWDSTYTVTANDVKSDTEKLESAMDTTKRVVVRMDTSKHSAEVLKETLGYMNFAAIPTKALADSDRPVCQAAK